MAKNNPSLIIFADSEVGYYCLDWLINNFKEDLAAVVTISENKLASLAVQENIANHIFISDLEYLEFLSTYNISPDLGFLLWWPKIISAKIINSVNSCFVNTHPSLLPFNRGKHYNFWCLVEQCPFGVSLHIVEEGIDCGPIISQSPIPYTWEDTGESLFYKAIEAMKTLVIETYPIIRTLNFPIKTQDLRIGSYHSSSEIEQKSFIDLDQKIRARDLFNLLRARTFPGLPACTFRGDDGVIYEIKVHISKK